ncbi:MAG: peptide-methionine (S)-S-oxide reductase MsrA [Rhodanobacteraceae bacterium]|nr:peptide-methionine (S)-S-oxide reductase MsrA [Rhodanobacteraceae bacterium]
MKSWFRSISLPLLAMIAMSTTSPAAETASTPSATRESIVLGGGCFWCLEAVYEEVRGVDTAVSGYAGGHVENPTYTQVSGARTGHAEVVKIDFDPKVVSLDTVLDVFFTIHDPTTLNRQGNDSGPQYRSVAFYGNEAQKKAIEAAIARSVASGDWRGSFVTEVLPLPTFYAAEDYHQEYFELNGEQPYCSLVIAPKVAKFKKRFASMLK